MELQGTDHQTGGVDIAHSIGEQLTDEVVLTLLQTLHTEGHAPQTGDLFLGIAEGQVTEETLVVLVDLVVDKGLLLRQLNAFGYNSLHYICRLKTGGLRFELQMRTALQHVWSTIEHDIGYKGDVQLPPEFRRQFSRLAGMLELADDEFSRLRSTITDYRRKIQSLVKSGRLDDVALSNDSFRSFVELNPFERLNNRIAAVNQAEIYPVSMMPYLPLLESFGMETLGDVQRFIEDNSEDAYLLALSQLAVTDLDILSSSTALQYLCVVYVLKNYGGRKDLKFIYDTINGKNDANEILADMILEQAKSLAFMQQKKE